MNRSIGAPPAFGAKWESLDPPLTPWILDLIHKMGFSRTTPVQAGTIPRALKNQDCVVEAVTGSGKTLAFVVPTLERIARRGSPYRKGQVAAIVIAPTRELAQQIHQVFTQFISPLHAVQEVSDPSSSRSRSPSPHSQPDAAISLPLLVTSGTLNPYETFLSQSSSIIIGTPGRLASFLLSPRGISVVKVSELDVLVLDEADRLLSAPDHRRDVERIMAHLPKQRRTHLFSATMTDAVEEIVGLGLRNPVRIVVNLKDKRKGEEPQERRTPTGLQNTYLTCRHAEKTLQMLRLLRREAEKNEAAKFIVYFSTCAAVDYFYRILSRLPELAKYHLTSFHGDLPPRIRETALRTFTSHPSSHLTPAVLLCTDVAARGVDFEDVDVVIQFDPPTDPKTFSHRAGRTARAGRKGKAVVLLGKGREEGYVDFLAVRKIPVMGASYVHEDLSEGNNPPALDTAATSLMEQMRKIVQTDRELADKGAKAFVSAMRAYTKHEASYIFRVTDLNFASVGIAYGLLRLPAMPEIREWRRKVEREKTRRQKNMDEGGELDANEDLDLTEWEDADVNWDTFAYLSKQRESARIQALEEAKAKKADLSANPQQDEKKRKIKAELKEAWSVQKEKKARKEERREKKDKRKAAEWAANGDQEDVGMVEEFKRAKGLAKQEKKDEEEAKEVFDKEYKTLRKEMKEEKLAKKAKKGELEKSGGMFDDLD